MSKMRELMTVLEEGTTKNEMISEDIGSDIAERYRQLAASNPRAAKAIYWFLKILGAKGTGPGRDFSDKILAQMDRIIGSAGGGQQLAEGVGEFSNDDLKAIMALMGL